MMKKFRPNTSLAVALREVREGGKNTFNCYTNSQDWQRDPNLQFCIHSFTESFSKHLSMSTWYL